MGDEPHLQLVLLRFSGEISTKARATRHQFVRQLIHNLRDAIASQGITPRVRLSHNRIFVELPAHAEVDALTRVFGVQSLSVVEAVVPAELGRVVAVAEPLFRERVKGRRFAVRARRVGNSAKTGLSPREVERELGAALLPSAQGVDLSDPEITVYVELIDGSAYVLRDKTAAPAGLPLGVEGNALVLMSGGFDSAVAAWQIMRRGVFVDYVFCNLGGDTHRLGVLRVAKQLAERWQYGDRPRLHSVDFTAVVDELRERRGQRGARRACRWPPDGRGQQCGHSRLQLRHAL